LKRTFDLGRVKDKSWLAPTILLMPTVMVASYVVMRLMGMPVPVPGFSIVAVILLFCAFFVGGLGEELGWSGYAIEPLQGRWGALCAALAFGAGLGGMAPRAAHTGPPVDRVDRLVVPRDDRAASNSDLAL
jgi:hypothetical protein